ncbi:MAG: TolC family protein [Acidobacteriota bacterium]
MLAPPPVQAVTEPELVASFLELDHGLHHVAIEARREMAGLARVSAPSWEVRGLREESTGGAAAFTTEVLSLAVGLELGQRNAIERRRALAELAAEELMHRAELIDAVSELRGLILVAWRAEREVELREAGLRRVRSLLGELTRLVDAGEHARFDLQRLRALAAAQDVELRLVRADVKSSHAELATLSGREVTWVELAPASLEPGREDGLVERVRQEHPILAMLRNQLEAEDLAVELAGRSHPGRIALRGGFRRDDVPAGPRGEGYELELGYVLPSQSLRRLEQARARHDRAERDLSLAHAERHVTAELESALARLAALADIGTPDELDVESLREGSLRRYRSGESSVTELADVLVGLQERELLQLEVETAAHEARLDLDRITGLLTEPRLGRLLEELME